MSEDEVRAGVEALRAALCARPDHWLALGPELWLRGIGGLGQPQFETFRQREGRLERGPSPEDLEVFGHFGRVRVRVRERAAPTPIPDRALVERLAGFDARYAAWWEEARASGALFRCAEAGPARGYRGPRLGRPAGWWSVVGRPRESVVWLEAAELVDATRRVLWGGAPLLPAPPEDAAFLDDLLAPELLLERLRAGRLRLGFGVAWYWDQHTVRGEDGQLFEQAPTGEWVENPALAGWPVDAEEPVFEEAPVSEERVRSLLAGEQRVKLIYVTAVGPPRV